MRAVGDWVGEARVDVWRANHGAKHGQGQGFVVLPLVLGQQRERAHHAIFIGDRIEEPGGGCGGGQTFDVAAVAFPRRGNQWQATQAVQRQRGRGECPFGNAVAVIA